MTITINKDISREDLLKQSLSLLLPSVRFTDNCLLLLRIIAFNRPEHLKYPFSNVAIRDIEKASEAESKESHLNHRKIKLIQNELSKNKLLDEADDFKLRKELETFLRNIKQIKEDMVIQFKYTIIEEGEAEKEETKAKEEAKEEING